MRFDIKALAMLHGLQVFGGEGGAGGAAGGSAGAGAGADGAGAAGVTAPDAGERILTGLGVPADKISKRSRARVSAMHRDDGAAAEAAQTQDDAANGTDDGQEMPKRLTWDEIMADPEYNEQAQKMMQKRLAKSKKSEQALKDLTPALELMARKYGIDAEDISKLDVQALNKAVTEDKAYYEERADELGIPVEEAMRIDQLERRNKLLEHQNEQTLEQRRLQEHFDGLVQQAAKLQETYPGFDLQTELENPVFARLTAPGSLISVEDAYFAVHRKEIQTAAMQVAAQKTAQQISNSIQAGQRRPAENGSASQAASISAPTTMSRARRDEIKRRMRSAAANGEKLYPGTF